MTETLASESKSAAPQATVAPLSDACWLGVLGFALRFGVCAWAAKRFPPVEDGHFYHIVASRIAEGLGYTWRWADGAVTYAAHYPVGYPALVGGAYALFGAKPFVAMLLNAMLGSAAIVAAHRIVACVADRRAALVAASIVLAHPALVFYTPALMTESVAGSVWICGAWAAVASSSVYERRPWLRLVIVGVFGGLASLVRPQLIVLSFPLGMLAARHRGRSVVLGAAFVTAVALAVCVPWTARNCMRLDRCAFVSANGGWNLLIGVAEGATGTWTPIEGPSVPAECREVFGEADKDACFRRAAIAEIGRDPWRWIGLVPEKLAFTFDFGGAPGWYLHVSNPAVFDKREKWALGAVETLVQRIVLLASLWALARLDGPRRRARRVAFVIFAPFALIRAAWIAYLGVVALAVLLGSRAWRFAPAALAAMMVGATAVTHAVFFGAGRYALVCYPALAALAGTALTAKRGTGDTGG